MHQIIPQPKDQEWISLVLSRIKKTLKDSADGKTWIHKNIRIDIETKKGISISNLEVELFIPTSVVQKPNWYPNMTIIFFLSYTLVNKVILEPAVPLPACMPADEIWASLQTILSSTERKEAIQRYMKNTLTPSKPAATPLIKAIESNFDTMLRIFTSDLWDGNFTKLFLREVFLEPAQPSASQPNDNTPDASQRANKNNKKKNKKGEGKKKKKKEKPKTVVGDGAGRSTNSGSTTTPLGPTWLNLLADAAATRAPFVQAPRSHNQDNYATTMKDPPPAPTSPGSPAQHLASPASAASSPPSPLDTPPTLPATATTTTTIAAMSAGASTHRALEPAPTGETTIAGSAESPSIADLNSAGEQWDEEEDVEEAMKVDAAAGGFNEDWSSSGGEKEECGVNPSAQNVPSVAGRCISLPCGPPRAASQVKWVVLSREALLAGGRNFGVSNHSATAGTTAGTASGSATGSATGTSTGAAVAHAVAPADNAVVSVAVGTAASAVVDASPSSRALLPNAGPHKHNKYSVIAAFSRVQLSVLGKHGRVGDEQR